MTPLPPPLAVTTLKSIQVWYPSNASNGNSSIIHVLGSELDQAQPQSPS